MTARAADFTLPDAEGHPWHLGDALEHGAVLLVFYRGDWCPYCNGQLAAYARGLDRFTASGLQVAAVSVDSVAQNRALTDKLLLPFPVLSDPDGAVIRSYGVWTDAEGGVALPSVFVVKPGFEVAVSHVGRDYADRPPDDVLVSAGVA